MERRSSLRRPIHHNAMVHLSGGAVWPCIIADYCDGGLLIKYSLSASSAIKANQAMTPDQPIKVVFQEDSGETHTVLADPVHMMKSAAGIHFCEPAPSIIDILNHLSGDEIFAQIPNEEVAEITKECIAAIQNCVSPLLESAYPNIISSIKDSALKAVSDQVANATMAAATNIEQNRENLHHAFLSAIHDPMSHHEGEGESGTVSGRLSIIEKGEFEDWLTTRVITTKAETAYREQLLPLKMRLDSIGLADKKHHQSPFGPALIVNSFQAALSRLHVEHSIEKLAFQVFEKDVMLNLEDLYLELNEILIKHNVMSDLDIKRQVKKARDISPNKAEEEPKAPEEAEPQDTQPQSAAPASQTSNAQPAPPVNTDSQAKPVSKAPSNLDPVLTQPPQFTYGRSDDKAAPNQAEQQSVSEVSPPFTTAADADHPQSGPVIDNESNYSNIMGMVKSLQANQNAHAATDGAAEAPQETYSDSELKDSLSALQSSTANEVHALEERIGLLERVLGNLSNDPSETKAIDENQQVAIDVVDRFFNSLKGNPRINQDAKAQLFKLEVPVLKVLLENEGFFDDTNSPVRAVMNRIAQLGAKGARLSPAAKKRVETLVHEIVHEFEQDTAIFDSALEEFDKLIERQNSLYVKNVERVAAAAEGAHKVEQAKVAVAKELNHRIGQGHIPKAIDTLITQGWKDLLNLTHIRHGEESDEWHRYLAVIDDLMHYAHDPSQPIQLTSLVPTIQEGLKHVSGNNQTPDSVRDELKSFFEHVPSGSYETTTSEAHEVPETEIDIAQRNLRKSSELKPWILRAKSIEVGSWMELNRDNEETQYLRLVWIAKGYSKYVFVNHQGMKVVELGLFKLATYLRDGITIPDPDYEIPMVNQGLDDMVKDVYDKLAFEASHDKGSGLANRSEFCRQVRNEMKSGKRTASCGLLYVRYVSKHTVEELPLPDALVENVAEILKEKQKVGCITARISETDFIIFAIGDDATDLINHSRKSCLSVCDLNEESKHVMALSGESQAHLGFNNPESMMQHALTPIEKRQKELASIAASFDSTPKEEEAQTIADEAAIEQAPILIDSHDVSQEHSGLEETEFDVYCQKSMLISDDSIHEEQYELIIAEKGSDKSFEPQSEAQAKFLDQWWINLLMSKQQETDPLWDSIDYLRVKLSGYAFQDDLFKEQLILLADTGELRPNRIWFDLYFCSVIPNMHAAADMMKQLMAKGYRFCLDQFGTSQSPFPLLKVFPVDLIKIDQAFMDELNQESSDESAANSIVEVAHYLGKEVLASSVDSAICLQRMKRLGVDYVQGSTIAEYEKLG